MLETLEHEGYIMRDPDRAVYAPTGRTLMLSQGYDRHLWIGAVAEPIIGEFRGRIGWPSDVAICDRDAMVLVQTTRAQQGPITVARKPGFRAPVLVTALGRAYLAFCGEEERARIVALLAGSQNPWDALAGQPRKLHAMLEEVRQAGYGVTDDAYGKREFRGLAWAIAVPVGRDEQIFASINMLMLKSAVSREEAERSFLEPLRKTAARLAKALEEKSAGLKRSA
jgi:IclR family mhp operon transcriptional activator